MERAGEVVRWSAPIDHNSSDYYVVSWLLLLFAYVSCCGNQMLLELFTNKLTSHCSSAVQSVVAIGVNACI